jgi:hypothetical protein
MCMGIDPRRHQASGKTVRWVCPNGHDEEDDTPLPSRAYCMQCPDGRELHEWSEVTQRGPAREVERVAMPAELVAGGGSYGR